MSSSANASLHPTTDPDARVHTKHASPLVPPDPPLPTLGGDIPSYSAEHGTPSNNDMHPRDSPPTTTLTAALQVAQERHAHDLEALQEKHAQDVEALRAEAHRAHADVKAAAHERDLVALRAESERFKALSTTTTTITTTTTTAPTTAGPTTSPQVRMAERSAAVVVAAPRVRFLTTGISVAEAKRAVDGDGDRGARGGLGDRWVKSAVKVAVKARERGDE